MGAGRLHTLLSGVESMRSCKDALSKSIRDHQGLPELIELTDESAVFSEMGNEADPSATSIFALSDFRLTAADDGNDELEDRLQAMVAMPTPLQSRGQRPKQDGFTSRFQSSSGTPLKRSSSAAPDPLDGLLFFDTFDKFSKEESDRLNRVYQGSNGKMPSRRGIKTISEQLEIPQCKIKRWFDSRSAASQNTQTAANIVAMHQQVLSPSGFAAIMPKPKPDPEIMANLEELEVNAEQLEGINQQISGRIVAMFNKV